MSQQYDATVRERFESKFVPITECGCWIWLGAAGRYGNLTVQQRHYDAHRFAWLLYLGSIPEGMRVLHRCDTPLCVNPAHLFLGTAKDNTLDMVRKGRHKPNKRNMQSGDNHWTRRRMARHAV